MKKFTMHRSYLVIIVLALIVASGIAAWFIHHKKTLPIPKPVAINASVTNPHAQLTVTPDPNVGGGPGNGSGSTNSAPVYPPYGSFVSNYNPKPADQEQSTCNTTPGATCTISFTKDGTTKSLDSQTVSDGNSKNAQAFASWSWTPSELGLSPGAWKITATASLNGHQVSTSPDKLLEVGS